MTQGLPRIVPTRLVIRAYFTSDFPEASRQVISMLSFILGYFNDEFTDASILGFLSTLSPGQPPAMIFDFARFIADNIHYQLAKFPTEGVFRYSSYLFHLFLFFEAEHPPIALKKMDVEGQPLSMIFWTSLLRKEGNEFSYKHFSYLFIRTCMNLIYKSEQPRVSEEMKRILQISEQCKVGDWYLYQRHT